MNTTDDIPDLCCPICFSCFSERENVPHMLKCGHTHCNVCLGNLIGSGTGKCGECRTTIAYRNVHMMPINYSILRLKEVMKTNEAKYCEYSEVETKIEKMMKNLNETEDMYKSRIQDTIQKLDDIEADKNKLHDLKKNLGKEFKELGNSNSLNKSFSIIKATMGQIQELNQQSVVISEVLSRGNELDRLQSLLDRPESACIKYNTFKTTCFILGKKIYMNSIHENFQQGNKFEIHYSFLHPFLVGAFMILEYKGRFVQLEFKLFKENQRAKQLIELCMAEDGSNYQSAMLSHHSRIGQEGESVVLGFNNAERSKSLIKDLNKGNCKTDIRKGYLEGLGNDKAKGTHFRIYFEDWPCRRSPFCFGKLTRGGSILRSIIRNKYETKITKCGLIFDPTLQI